MTQVGYKSGEHIVIAIIIIAYLIVGVSYAVYTPAWQTPDEPAHYNYVKYIADNGSLPQLRVGDYPHEYLEQIKARKFPSDMPINQIRYEFHQPPLYYLLATPVYLAARGLPLPQQVIVLRCFSLLFGAALIGVAYCVVREILSDARHLQGDGHLVPYEERELIALATAAFLVVVPMHVAMTAAINNDALAELFVGLILWRLMLYLNLDLRGSRLACTRQGEPDRVKPRRSETRQLVIIGILVGVGFLVKTTLYIIAGVALVAIILKLRRAHATRITHHSLLITSYLLPIALIATPWFIRNAVIYGNYDFFGWQRHDAIVVGQLRTAEAVARYGAGSVLRDFFQTTFHSFWAQFGWMGVPVDSRIYLALAILCTIAGVGLALFLIRNWQFVVGNSQFAIVALTALLGGASHVWYNLKFLQHQGRYLFPAIVPLGFFFAVGLWESGRAANVQWIIGAAFAGILGTMVRGVVARDWNKWALLLWSAALALWTANAVWLRVREERESSMRWRVAPFALIYAGLYVLDFVCLFKFIVPALR